MAKVQIEMNLKGLERQVKNLKKLPMLKTGLKAHELNEEQIENYKDRYGRKFKPYSTSYANKKGVGVNNVDLTSNASVMPKSKRTGHMLQNFGVVRTMKNKVIIGFTSMDAKIKAWFNVDGKKKREFVGLSKKNRQKLLTFFYRIISKGV